MIYIEALFLQRLESLDGKTLLTEERKYIDELFFRGTRKQRKSS